MRGLRTRTELRYLNFCEVSPNDILKQYLESVQLKVERLMTIIQYIELMQVTSSWQKQTAFKHAQSM